MIDIVDRSIPDVNLNEVLHRVYNIVEDKGTLFNGMLVVKFFIEFIPSHTSEIVPARGEKHRS